MRSARSLVLLIVACGALAGPGTAGAHSRAPAAALDYRLRLASTQLTGVRAKVLDGDRELRLTVEPSLKLTVLGLIGEPFLRFDRRGVWVSSGSPTAAADKLVPARGEGRGWIRLTRTHELTWHDHRLSPPPNIPVGSSAPFALPVEVDGRRAVLGGRFTHVAGPRLWPWLLAAVAALVAAIFATPERRGALAATTAAVAAAAALASSIGFATGEAITRLDQWVEVASAAVLALGAAALLRIRKESTRTWWAMVIGVVAAALSVGSLEVFWHGVVISSLPATLARLATGVAAIGGLAAGVLGIVADEDQGHRRSTATHAKAVAR